MKEFRFETTIRNMHTIYAETISEALEMLDDECMEDFGVGYDEYRLVGEMDIPDAQRIGIFFYFLSILCNIYKKSGANASLLCILTARALSCGAVLPL